MSYINSVSQGDTVSEHCKSVQLQLKRSYSYQLVPKNTFGSYDLLNKLQFSCSVVSDSLRPHEFSVPGFPVHHQLLELTQTHVHQVSDMPSNHLILCCPLLLLPSVFPSIRVFLNESAVHIRWPKYCSFSFSISPSNEHPGLISFRMDWLDLFAVQGTLKRSSLTPQFKNISSLVLSLLYGPALTSIHDYWKNHSFD